MSSHDIGDGAGTASAKASSGSASDLPPPSERRWRLGGYAPGGYLCKCLTCGRQFDGDKRAVACLPCAAQAAEAETARLSALLDQAREGNRSSRSDEHSLAKLGRSEAQHSAGWREPVAHLVERSGKGYGKPRRVLLVEEYDPRKPEFWAGGVKPRNYTVTPLFAHPPAESSADERSPEGASAPLAMDEPFLTRLSKTGGEGEEGVSPSRTSPSSPDSRPTAGTPCSARPATSIPTHRNLRFSEKPHDLQNAPPPGERERHDSRPRNAPRAEPHD